MLRAQIERIGPPVRPPCLRKMYMGVDETRRDPHPDRICDVDAFGHRTLRSGAGAVDLPFAKNDIRIRDRRAAAAIDQRAANERARRGGRAGWGADPAGDRDLPAVRRLDEQPLRDSGVLVTAGVANAIAIRAVHPSPLQRRRMNLALLDAVG